MTDYKLVPVEPIMRAIYALERFANDDLAGRNSAHELRELLAAAPDVQGEPVGLSRFIEMIEARASIRKSGMIDGIILLRDLKAMLAAAPSAPQPAEQQPAPDVARLIICDECHAKCADPYAGLFASHCPDEEPCIMCECISLRRQLAEQQPAPSVSGLVEALERFVEAWTDCQQQPVHAEEFEILTDICEDSLKALAAHHKQGGES